jgi:hypothetical protein
MRLPAVVQNARRSTVTTGAFARQLRSTHDVARARDLGGDVAIAGDGRGLHDRIAALGLDLLDQRRQGLSKIRVGLDGFLELPAF